VRVRSYVVETPVTESVNLREENVHVERRPVDRTATPGDEVLFKDRTIEMEERAEEAVVEKEARVREELVINKQVGERTETVSDTVRRTEVDIEDDRTDLNRSDLDRTGSNRGGSGF
jgi:stress response protein YsnF